MLYYSYIQFDNLYYHVDVYLYNVKLENWKRKIYEVSPIISERMRENIEFSSAKRNGTQIIRSSVKTYSI